MPDFALDEGLLTKRISIYAQPTGANALNEHTTAGTLVCKLWADLNPSDAGKIRPAEILRAGGDEVEAQDVWRVRYDSRIRETQSVVWNDQRWRIVGVTIKGAKQGMDIQAVRVGVDDTSNL